MSSVVENHPQLMYRTAIYPPSQARPPTHSSSLPPVISSAITSPGSWPVQTGERCGRQGFVSWWATAACQPSARPTSSVPWARSHHGLVIAPRAVTARHPEQVFNVQNVHSGFSARGEIVAQRDKGVGILRSGCGCWAIVGRSVTCRKTMRCLWKTKVAFIKSTERLSVIQCNSFIHAYAVQQTQILWYADIDTTDMLANAHVTP
jgi:hypothetical protein